MFFKRFLLKLFRSLQWKLVFIFICITFVLMGSVYAILTYAVQSLYYNNFKNDIETSYKNWTNYKDIPSTNSELLSHFKPDRNSNNSRDDVYFFHTNDLLSLTILDKTKLSNVKERVIYSSDTRFNGDEKEQFSGDIFFRSGNLISICAGGGYNNSNQLIHTPNKDYFEYIKMPDKGNFILYFMYDKTAWSKIIEGFNNIIIGSSVVAIFISVLLGYIMSRTITSPIIDVMHKAQKMAAGDFDYVLQVRSDDEIGKLTRTFNFMAKELKNTLSEIYSEKNKIETILNYLTDGVVAFNLKGEMIHANPAARKMLGMTELNNDTFNEFSVKYGLGIMLEEVLYLDSSISKEKEIQLDDKYIRVYFAEFTDEGKKTEGLIAVLQDITEQQKLEKMRQEFVANVSHELRTPLTSIKSYTETLLDGALDDRETTEKFLGVINSESDRMTRLVKDLLQLTKFDNQQMNWKLGKISFVELVRSAVERMQINARNKNQLLECFVIGEISDITADYDRIEQVVLNILSNALKYTPHGGKITVYIGNLYSDVYMKVTDTGIGIPKEDLSRVFERFYRVDKARSREMGGTGLGLAIAKEIVEAHGGSISMSSEVEKGTEVMVKLPVQRNVQETQETPD